MRPSFMARLVNGPRYDPLCHVRVLNAGFGLLFDCGRFRGLTPRELLGLRAVCVSHCHMDHFMGFDEVLRAVLHREAPLRVYGPEGIIEALAGRLRCYSWNLTAGYPFAVEIFEVSDAEVRTAVARAGEGFVVRRGSRIRRGEGAHEGLVVANLPRCRLSAQVFDHGIPCLGFALEERWHLGVRAERIRACGLTTGPWIGELKERILAGECGGELVVSSVRGGQTWDCNRLVDEFVIFSPGQKIAYITDLRWTPENVERAVALAGGCQTLFVEAYFAHELEELAASKGHLTARQAGLLARRLGAGQVVPMHVSPRHHGGMAEILDEVRVAREGRSPET